jgi:SAM-dependent methyltransferase
MNESGETLSGYFFDPYWDKETERLRTNESLWDAGTVERFNRIGVRAGWSCLEVGAGYGSAAHWLSGRVGRSGRVVATDVHTERLDWLIGPQLEVWRHDVTADALPDDTFDLVHARMVLEHVSDRTATTARLIRTLRPGGWLFIEDTDPIPLFRSYQGEDFLAEVKDAGLGLMRRAGHDALAGHTDLRIALTSGLVDVTAEGRAVMVQGGSIQAHHYQLWLEYLRPKLLAAGLLDETGINAALIAMADPNIHWLSQVMISTIGRKPLLPGDF